MKRCLTILIGCLWLSLMMACQAEPDMASTLSFVEEGDELQSLSLDALIKHAGTEQWRAFDPYYQREKAWRTLPLHPVLEAGFKRPVTALADVEFVLRAVDGYTVPISGARLLEPGAYIAYADEEVPTWEPIGSNKAHPGPFYLFGAAPSSRSSASTQGPGNWRRLRSPHLRLCFLTRSRQGRLRIQLQCVDSERLRSDA